MPITIDKESRRRKRMPIDLDNMSERYKTTSGYFTFTSPDLWVIEKNLFYLLRNSTQKVFDSKYKMKPDYLSFDEYGTVQLAQMLMYVNGVPCLEKFDLQTIIVPSFDSIVQITKDKYPKKTISEVDSISW